MPFFLHARCRRAIPARHHAVCHRAAQPHLRDLFRRDVDKSSDDRFDGGAVAPGHPDCHSPQSDLFASSRRPLERMPRGLAQTCVHHQVQSPPSRCLWAIHRRALQRPGGGGLQRNLRAGKPSAVFVCVRRTGLTYTVQAPTYVDQSPYVARRLGFAALPLGCLVVRIISQACEMLVDENVGDDSLAGLGKMPSPGRSLTSSTPQAWLAQLGGWLAVGSIAFSAWTWSVLTPPGSMSSPRRSTDVSPSDSLVAIKLLIGCVDPFRRFGLGGAQISSGSSHTASTCALSHPSDGLRCRTV